MAPKSSRTGTSAGRASSTSISARSVSTTPPCGDVRITGAWIQDLVIEGEIEGSLLVNGVDVLPTWRQALNATLPGSGDDLRGPRRATPTRSAPRGRIDEEVWATTVERARRLPEEKLHERVDGEWSFVQTLRHLVFATDSWVLRAIQGDPYPYDPLDLPVQRDGRDRRRAQRRRRPPVARRGAGAARRPHGHRQRGDRGPHRRGSWRGRPSRWSRWATRSPSRSRSAAAWARS